MKNKVMSLAFLAFAGAIGATAATAQDEQRAEKLFAGLDADKSGDITLTEFTATMKNRINAMDGDKNGTATVGEIALALKLPETDARVTRFLAQFDANKDGGVTVAETEARRQLRFTRLDVNADGKLVPDELKVAAHGTAAKGDKPKSTNQ